MSSPASKPQDEPVGPAPDESLSILLVEDNPGDARLFEDYLRESSTESRIRHEETLQAGLRALEETRPDVLVVDLGLPDSEGAETVKAAAAAAPGVPIVVLTGQGDLQVALEVREAGATEYLQKDELTPALVARTLRWAAQQYRMQAKLRQRDAWVRSITERLSAGVFRTGPTGRIEYANEALAEMLGADQAEKLVGRDLTGFYVDPLQKGRMLAAEEASDVEVEFERQDGSTFVGLLSATVAYDAEGKPLHYDGTVTDITERTQRKERLRMLSEAVDQAKESVLITEAEPLEEPGPRIEYINAACEKMTGYSEEEILGETPRVLQGPDTDREVLDSLRAALEAGKEWEGETVNYRKDEKPYRVQWNVSPVMGEDGEIERWVSVQRDVTDERKREEALRRQKNLLEQTQRLAGAWEVDLRTEELTWSEELYRIHEVEPGTEVSLEEAFDFFLPKGRETLRSAFERCIQEGRPYDVEVPLLTAKDTPRWARAVGAPAKTEDGEVVKVAGAFQDITEQKEAERELRRSREQLSMALEGGNIGTWNWDVATGELIFNRQWAEMLGYTREELDFQFSTWERLVHPEDLRRAADVLERYVEGEIGRYDQEIRMQAKSGEWKWIQTIGKVVERGSDGTASRIAGIHLDIDERKRAEEALREREAQLRGLTNSIPGVVFQAYARPERDYGFHFVSDRAEEVMGISADPEEFFERCMRQVPESERERLMNVIDEAVEQEDHLEFEVPFVKPSGETTWLLGTSTPEPREEELIYNGVILDISQRKRHQKRLATIVDRVTDAIVEVDSEWRFTLVNEQAEALYDMTEDDLLSEEFWDVFEEALGTRFEEEYRGVMQSREATRFEEHYPGLDGWFDIQVYPNDDGGLAFYFEEITERKKREQELREAKEEAEEASRLKSAMLANMSHEIRTPLTSITGFSEILVRNLEGELKHFAERIHSGGKRLQRTLESVLHLSKLEAGVHDLQREELSLGAVATDVVQMLEDRATAKSLTVKTQVPDPAVSGNWNEDALHRICRNLLENALKFTPEGGQVEVRVSVEDQGAVLEVEDTGIGMDPEKVPELFRAFKQESEGMSREYEGTGLGLSIVERLTEELGGEVEVQTEKKEGTCFTVRLPFN